MREGRPADQRFLNVPGGAGGDKAFSLPSSGGFAGAAWRWMARGVAAVRAHRGLQAASLGLLWMALQLGALMMLVPEKESLPARYDAVLAGDIAAYQAVMEGGLARYGSERVPPSLEGAKTMLAQELQVAPGYPLAALLMQKALAPVSVSIGLPAPGARLALGVTAQLMTWALWAYIIAFMLRWKAGGAVIGLTMALVMLHPEALSLVGIGPGALFLAMALGMVFWAAESGGGLLSAAHGAVATATRLFVAVPVVLSGLALAHRKRRRGAAEGIREVERRAWIALLAVLPLALYLALLQGRFGAVDLYLHSLGLSSATWSRLAEPSKLWAEVSAAVGGRTLMVWAGLLALFLAAEAYLLFQQLWQRVESRFRARAPFYLMAVALFALAAVATALKGTPAEMGAGVREPLGFGLEIYLMVILAYSHILSRLATRSLAGKAVTVIVVGLMAFLQFWAQNGGGLVSLLE